MLKSKVIAALALAHGAAEPQHGGIMLQNVDGKTATLRFSVK